MEQLEGTTRRSHRRKPSRLRIIAIVVAAVVVLFALAVGIDSILYNNKIHAGVTVAGVGLGGMTRDEAKATLTQLIDEAQKKEITLTSEKKSWPVLPTDVGAQFDVDTVVSAAMEETRDSNFVVDLGHRLGLYFKGVDIPLVGSVDSAKMDAVIGEVAEELDVPPVNAGLKLQDSEVQVVEGKPGHVVDREALAADLTSLVLTLHNTELPVPMMDEAPDIQAADTGDAVEQAKTMMSGPVTLKAGEDSWSLQPEEIISFMDFTTEDQNGVPTLVSFLSSEKMTAWLETPAEKVAVAAVNAKFKTDGTNVTIVPAVSGKKLDPAGTAAALTKAALATDTRTAQVALTESEADLTTEEAEAMGIKDKLATFTTEPYAGSANRQHNVRITTEYASDVILAPGEIYDFDKQIGPRTSARGYKTAPGITAGQLEEQLGGGICQVSTTLFNAVFFAGLEVVERKNHSIYIDHYPKGRDATVSAGGPNFRFRNDTQHHILIRGTSDGTTTTFSIYGTDEGRKVSYTTSDFYNAKARTTVTTKNPKLPAGKTVTQTSGQSGKQCKVVRTITYADGTQESETFISTYPMRPQIIEVGTAATSTTKPPTSTTEKSTTTTVAPATTTPTS